MSDELAGRAPEDGTPVHDAALDAVMAQWMASTPDTIDVEQALAAVTARRRADAVPAAVVAQDDLAARRSSPQRDIMRATPWWQQTGWRAAAAVLVVLGATAILRSTRGESAAETFVTTVGAAKEIRLADGTSVRLGPSSRMTVDAGYGNGHRHVTLQGEAWFNVTHDESRPFAIRVGAATVEDVGTAFLVRELATHDVSVRVAEGAVRVTTPAAAHDSTVMLHAGDGAVATAAGITVAPGVVSASEGAAMAEGRLAFSDASLVEVQEALRRWYGVTLQITDSSLGARHVTADFTGEPVSRVAAVLGLTLGVHAEAHGDTIELRTATGAPARP